MRNQKPIIYSSTQVLLFYLCLLAMFVMMLTSCYNQNKAVKQVAKAELHYPLIIAEKCAKEYPPKEVYVKGKDSISYDTLFVGENIIDTLYRNDTIIIFKTSAPKIITKTITKIDTIKIINTAAQEALTIKLNDCNIEKAKQERDYENKLNNKAKSARQLRNILIAIILILVLMYIYEKYFKKLKF